MKDMLVVTKAITKSSHSHTDLGNPFDESLTSWLPPIRYLRVTLGSNLSTSYTKDV